MVDYIFTKSPPPRSGRYLQFSEVTNQRNRLIGLRLVWLFVQYIVFWQSGVFGQEFDGIPELAEVPLPIESPAPPAPDEVFQRLDAMDSLTQELQQRVLQMEEMRLQVKTLSDRLAKIQAKEDKDKESGLAGPGGYKPRPSDSVLGSGSRAAQEEAGARSSGIRALPYSQIEGNRYLGKVPLYPFFDYGRDGIGLETKDGEFLLKFRGEAQIDFLNYAPTIPQQPFQDGFYLPRVRYYFQGRYTKPVDYQMSFQQSYSSFGFLNVFLNFNYTDEKAQFRFGRFKVPFTYEWYKLNNWRFITPERSLFAENFGMNRQVGAMMWGQVVDKKVEYAVGIFDGARNSQQDYNNGKDLVGFINVNPFDNPESVLHNLNIGGSVDYGIQNNPLQPAVLRTNSNSTSDTLISTNPVAYATVPFLAFNAGVTEKGPRQLNEVHLAYFYRGLSLISAWNTGTVSYAPAGGDSTHIPVNGYSISTAYLLTGETLNERTVIDPINRFDLRPGKVGFGAFEPFARYCELNIGNQIFTNGIANASQWTNRVSMVDVGMNWYLNRGVKVYLDWEHAMFGQPNSYGTGASAKTNDLFWTRLQLYY